MHAMWVTSTLALLPAATPVPPASSTVTAKLALPGHHHHHNHHGALKPRTTSTSSFDPAAIWPEVFVPNGWPGFHDGWSGAPEPCHASQFYSCASPYLNGDDGCPIDNPYDGGGFGNRVCLCERAPKFLTCMSQAHDDDPACWKHGYTGDNWQMNWYHNWCGDVPPPSVMSYMSQPTTVNLIYTTVNDAVGGGTQPAATRVDDPLYKGSGSLLSGECTSTDFTTVLTNTNGLDTMIYAGFQGCNDDRPQCCPWPVATTSAENDSPSTINVEIDPEIEIEHKAGNAWPQPAHGHKGTLKHCPADYYSVSGGCCPAGFYFFTAALGGETPCWRPLSKTAHVPPVTENDAIQGAPTTNAETRTEPGDFKDSSVPSAINNVIFSRHYPVDEPKGKATGSYVGMAVGISLPMSAALTALFWFLRHRRRQKREKLRKAREHADNYNYYNHIWDGTYHDSRENLFQGPGQELQTFNSTRTRNFMNRTDSVQTTTSSQQISHLQQRQNELTFQRAQRRNTENMYTTDHNTPGFPPPVRIPRRVSSAAAVNNNAARGRYSYGQQLGSHHTSGVPLARYSGNAWGAHAFEKARGEKEVEENPFAAGSSSGSSTHLHGNQQQRQTASAGQHSAGRESGYGYHGEEEDEEGYLEPPPEYKA